MARKLSGSAVADDTATSTSETNETNTTEESNTMSTATEETVAESVNESTESEATEAANTEAPEATEAKAAPAEIDMTEFEGAVQAAVDGRDPSTGTVAEALAAPVTTAYQNLSVGGKSKAKAHLLTVMTSGVEGGDLSLAMAASQLQKVLIPAGKSAGAGKPKAEVTPADPNEAVATQLAALRTAFVYLQNNLPEGAELETVKSKTTELADAAAEQLEGYITWLNRDKPAEGEDDTPEPEGVSVITKKAARLVLTKVKAATSGGASRSSGDGVRRNVATHISQVFADKPSGHFMSINEIANSESEEYAGVKISSGAVSARLFPTDGPCTLTDVTPATVEGKRGATKN